MNKMMALLLSTGGKLKRYDAHYANYGYLVKDWYIKKKYDTLEDELKNNGTCRLDDVNYTHLRKKAETKLGSSHCKSFKSRAVPQYGIDESPLLDHIIHCSLL